MHTVTFQQTTVVDPSPVHENSSDDYGTVSPESSSDDSATVGPESSSDVFAIDTVLFVVVIVVPVVVIITTVTGVIIVAVVFSWIRKQKNGRNLLIQKKNSIDIHSRPSNREQHKY